MMGLGELQLLAKFEVAGFIYYGNMNTFIRHSGRQGTNRETDNKGEAPNFGELP